MTPPTDLDALMRKLAEVIETATIVALHKSDWDRLGLRPHMPLEMTAVRVDVLLEALMELGSASDEALVAAARLLDGVRREQRLSNVVELRRAA